MTHAEQLAGNTAGIPTSECRGQLELERDVLVYRCVACDARVVVSIAAGKQEGDPEVRTVLNAYTLPRPVNMLDELAKALASPGSDDRR